MYVCTVLCLSIFQTDIIRDRKKLKDFNHQFNGDCIYQWLNINNSYPFCREITKIASFIENTSYIHVPEEQQVHLNSDNQPAERGVLISSSNFNENMTMFLFSDYQRIHPSLL